MQQTSVHIIFCICLHLFVGWICRSWIAGSNGGYNKILINILQLTSREDEPIYTATNYVFVIISPHTYQHCDNFLLCEE